MRSTHSDIPISMHCDARYEIRFESLFHKGRALVFPCDAHGHVLMDELSEQARENYLYARAVVGREYAAPIVLPVAMPIVLPIALH